MTRVKEEEGEEVMERVRVRKREKKIKDEEIQKR